MTLNWSLYNYSSPWFSESRTKWCTTRRQGGASKETIRQNRTNFNPLWTLDCDILSPVTPWADAMRKREREVLEKKIKLCTKRIAMRLVSQGNLQMLSTCSLVVANTKRTGWPLGAACLNPVWASVLWGTIKVFHLYSILWCWNLSYDMYASVSPLVMMVWFLWVFFVFFFR